MNPVEVEVEILKNEYEYEIAFESEINPVISFNYYDGDYTVTPSSTQQVLPTWRKGMKDDVTVEAVPAKEAFVTPTVEKQEVLPEDGYFFSRVNVAGIPYREVADSQGNITVYIG